MPSEVLHGLRIIKGTVPFLALTTALQTQLNGYVTPAQLDQAIANLIDAAPEALNTLNELSAAIGDDPNFAGAIATQLGQKATKQELADIIAALIAGETTFNNLKKTGDELRRLDLAIQNSGTPGAGSYFSGFVSADMAKLTNPANWDAAGDGKYTGPALVTNYATFVLVPSPAANTPSYRFETDGSASGVVRFIGL